ncbi:MAG: AAA family ATPase [Deltaproteobacteria bacterium]|nr:AAA family ATPase [Deltaproteobacteria bacterium]
MPASGALRPYVCSGVLRRLGADPESALSCDVEEISAAALFADVADSTRTVESLAERGREGAERFSVLLSAYFTKLIDTMEQFGGEVLKFDGDAVLAIWRVSGTGALADAARRAGACAFAFQDAAPMLASGSEGRLQLRAGVGAGPASIVHVSDGVRRSEMFMVGPAWVETLEASKAAERGGVVLGGQATRVLGLDDCAGDRAAVRAAMRAGLSETALPPPPRDPRSEIDASVASALSHYVPRVVRSRSLEQQSQWLAELRTLTTVFIGLGLDGIEVDSRLFGAVSAVLQSIARFGGDVARVGAHGNGVAVLTAFGLPPHGHEDDADRASRAAMAVRDELAGSGIEVSIGVTTGRVFCGPVGSSVRREYTMIGDAVNVAARLMNAARGEVLCDAETRQASRGRVRFGPVRVLEPRGHKGAVQVFEPIGYGQVRRPSGVALVGRDKECSQLVDALRDLESAGRGGVVAIEGEAGIGKSRLALFAADAARERGVDVVSGGSDSTESQVPFHAWRRVVVAVLGLSMPGDGGSDTADSDPSAADVEIAALEERLVRLSGMEAQQVRRMAPLLGVVLGTQFDDNGWTARLSPRARVEQTTALVLRILFGRRQSAPARDQSAPAGRDARLVVVLEDAHWFDAPSWSLLSTAVQASSSLLFVVTSRPNLGVEYRSLLSGPQVRHVLVEGLDSDSISTLAARRLEVDAVPGPLVRFLFERTRGHPFFAEELLEALRRAGALALYGGECRLALSLQDLERLDIPRTVEGVVGSRIDGLGEDTSSVLKVAGILSGTFAAADIAAVDPDRRDTGDIRDSLDGLVRDGLLVHDTAGGDRFTFRHAITQAVTYEMVPHALRRNLHRAAAEALGASEEAAAAVLAYHWSRAVDPEAPQVDIVEKAVAATEAAGEEATQSFANAAAVALFSEALALAELLPGVADAGRRAHWHRRIGEADFAAGWPEPAKRSLLAALDLLQRPVPASPAKLRLSLAGAIARQVAHRALPAAIVARASGAIVRDPARTAALREEAATSGMLSFVLLLMRETEASVLANLRALNAADRVGTSVELANNAAAFSLLAGTILGARVEAHYFEIALRAAESSGDDNTLGRVLWMRAFYLLSRARWDDAYRVLEKSCAIFEEVGDGRWYETVVMAIGNVFTLSYRFDAALEAYARGHRAAHARGDVQGEAWSHVGMSQGTLLRGYHREALAILAKVEAWMGGNLENLGDHASELGVLGMRAAALVHEGDVVGARRVLERAHAVLGPPNFLYHAVTGYTFLAEASMRLWEQAREGPHAGAPRLFGSDVEERASADADLHLRSMASEFERMLWTFGRRMPIGRAQALVWRGLRLWLSGKRARAFRAWERGAGVAATAGMPYDRALALYEFGRHLSPGDPRRSRRLEEARALFAEIGANYWVGLVETAMAPAAASRPDR